MFQPSKYQQAAFDAVQNGAGDILISAVAGSGKTKTLEEIVKRLPTHLQSRTLMTAFNSHIKEELLERQKHGKIPAAVTIQTIHGLGYGTLMNAFRPNDKRNWVDKWKYRNLTQVAWESTEMVPADIDEKRLVTDATESLARLALLTITDASDPDALLDLARHFGVDLPPVKYHADMLAFVPRILRWGREGLASPDRHGLTYHPAERISFDEMVALPVYLNLHVRKFDLCLIDECQDFNRVQQELLLRARGTGRAIWVGDRRQAIYGFAGADAESFDRIGDKTSAERLPLSICYRCAKSIVRVAKQFVPEIEAAPDAPEGAVISVTEAALLELVAGHHKASPDVPFLIVCRVTAPLITAAFSLIRRGVPARVAGRDIGASLVRTLEEMAKMPDFEMEAFVDIAIAYRDLKFASFGSDEKSEAQRQSVQDRVDSVVAVYEALLTERGTRGVSCSDMKARITDLFSDEAGAITLSTVHKSKGLEAQKVGILKANLMPHPMAHQAWEYEQERNLAYVAVTRAKEELYLCGAMGF